MRFIAIESIDQQSKLHLDVSRQRLAKMRTQLSNHCAGCSVNTA